MAASHPSELGARRAAVAVVVVLGLLAACGGDDPAPEMPGDAGRPSDVARAPVRAELEIPDDAPRVAFLGDSIAAGLHLARDEAFPAVLQHRLALRGHPFHLINAGVSGDTTAGGATRVDWILRQEPDVVVVELGANDGFRGVPLETVEANLREIVVSIQSAGARPVLLGIRLPPNYGADYTTGFDALYARVAEELETAHVPYFMRGVAGVPEMNLPDGIHPTPEGHRKLAENVANTLADVLADLQRAQER
jgi:acyl-CoA thioesterase-1